MGEAFFDSRGGRRIAEERLLALQTQSRKNAVRSLLQMYDGPSSRAIVQAHLEVLESVSEESFRAAVTLWAKTRANAPTPSDLLVIGHRVGKLRISSIFRYTAQQAGVSYEALLGPSRKRWASWPRQAALTRCHEQTVNGKPIWSLPTLGAYCGNRDHTTVLYAVRRIKQLRLTRTEDYMRPLTPEEIEMLKGVG